MNDYPMTTSEKQCGTLGSIRRQTLRERLIEQKTVFEAQLKNINDALDCMDKNPSFENFHNTISRAGF
jgi:hypothetical protein